MDDDHPADIGRPRRRGDRITPVRSQNLIRLASTTAPPWRFGVPVSRSCALQPRGISASHCNEDDRLSVPTRKAARES